MKHRVTLLLSTLIFLIIVFTLYFAGSVLSSPSPTVIGEPPKDFSVEQLSIQSESGTMISGWFMPGQENKGGILLMHGVRSNRLQMVERAKFFNKYGYSVLLFDFQGHGESRGKHITFGYLESLDANAAYSFLENRLYNKTIGVIGISLGGAAALLGKVAEKSAAIILEGVYPTIDEAITNRLTMRFGAIGKYMVPFLMLQIKPRLGFSPQELRPIDEITNVKGAVFVVNGTIDKHTTIEESKRLFENAHEPKDFWAVKGAGHIDICRFKTTEYKKKSLSFFDKYLIKSK